MSALWQWCTLVGITPSSLVYMDKKLWKSAHLFLCHRSFTYLISSCSNLFYRKGPQTVEHCSGIIEVIII